MDPNENTAGVGVDVAAVNFAPDEVAPNEKPAPDDDDAGGMLVSTAMAGNDPNEKPATEEDDTELLVCATLVEAGSEVDPNENAAGVGVDVAAVNFASDDVAPNEKPAPDDDDAG